MLKLNCKMSKDIYKQFQEFLRIRKYLKSDNVIKALKEEEEKEEKKRPIDIDNEKEFTELISRIYKLPVELYLKIEREKIQLYKNKVLEVIKNPCGFKNTVREMQFYDDMCNTILSFKFYLYEKNHFTKISRRRIEYLHNIKRMCNIGVINQYKKIYDCHWGSCSNIKELTNKYAKYNDWEVFDYSYGDESIYKLYEEIYYNNTTCPDDDDKYFINLFEGLY